MTTATRPRIATPVKREAEVTSKPKTIKIGHGYYDLKLLRDLVGTLPDGEVTLTSYPGKPNESRRNHYSSNYSEPPKVVCQYSRGCFNLNATELKYYAADKGKVKVAQRLTYYQGEDRPAKTFSLLSVELPMHKLAHDRGLIKSEV